MNIVFAQKDSKKLVVLLCLWFCFSISFLPTEVQGNFLYMHVEIYLLYQEAREIQSIN